jgi:chloride channel 3/4/5
MNDGLANGEASSSSSSQSPQHASHALPLRDEDHARRPDTEDSDLLGDDPLTQDHLAEPLSFKRKQKRPGVGLGLLTSLTGSLRDQRGGNDGPRAEAVRLQSDEPEDAPYPETYHSSPRRRGGGNTTTASTPKDGAPPDWHVEGPGQRVGYENLTAIDWIFEYTKERARLRVLSSSAVGLVGYAQRLLDASQEWVILVLTGLLVGALAAGIDIISDWLGDLKAGYCSTADGGAFYLNKNFCCMGYDEGAKCMGWRPWATALHVSSAAGKWIIEYFFFISLSVCSTPEARLLTRHF